MAGRGTHLTKPAWLVEKESSSLWKTAKTADGRQYWYNVVTRESRWEPPTTDQQTTTTSPQSSSVVWYELETADGKKYYCNQQTRETRWEPPVDATIVKKTTTVSATSVSSSDAKNSGESTSASHAVSSTTTTPWKEYKTRDGRTYFFNPTTGESRWEKPVPSGAVEEGLEDWIEYRTWDGKPYYYNKRTKVTSWTLPKVQQDESKEKKREERKVSLKRGQQDVVLRPRHQDGRVMTDREAELYFLKEATRKRKRGKSNHQKGTKKRDEEEEQETNEAVQNNHKDNRQAEETFMEMLQDYGIDENSRWLDAMYYCCSDPRYFVLDSYGQRHACFVKYKAKRASQKKLEQSKKIFRARSDFERMLQEKIQPNKIPPGAKTLEDCDESIITSIQEDERYAALQDERERKDLIGAYFSIIERQIREARRQERKERMSQVFKVLSELAEKDRPISGKMLEYFEKEEIEKRNRTVGRRRSSTCEEDDR